LLISSSVKFGMYIDDEYAYEIVHEILFVNQKLQNILIVWNFEVMYDQ
jgi:hypothetical protein